MEQLVLADKGILVDNAEQRNFLILTTFISKGTITDFLRGAYLDDGNWADFSPLDLVPGQEIKHIILLFNELSPKHKNLFRSAVLTLLNEWIPRTYNINVAEQDVFTIRSLIALATETKSTDVFPVLINLLQDHSLYSLRSSHPKVYQTLIESILTSFSLLLKFASVRVKLRSLELLASLYLEKKLEDKFGLQIFATLCQHNPTGYARYLLRFLEILESDSEMKLFPNRKYALGLFANRVNLNIFVQHLRDFKPQELRLVFRYMIDSDYNFAPDAPYRWTGLFPEQKWIGSYDKRRVANANAEMAAKIELAPHLIKGRVGDEPTSVTLENDRSWEKWYEAMTSLPPVTKRYLPELFAELKKVA